MEDVGAALEKLYMQVVPDALYLGREHLGLNSIDFTPRVDSPLFVVSTDGQPSTIRMAVDNNMCQLVLFRHHWEIEEIVLARRVCSGDEAITLVDVGANAGLFSRQALMAIPAIHRVIAYEPEPRNFSCLLHNLAPFGDAITFVNAALSDRQGEAELYLDPSNAGNFSLTASAMPPNHRRAIVDTRNVGEESLGWVSGVSRIFYKSDTQGYDEIIMASIAPQVWDSVFAGLMELWNISKPEYDKQAFAAVIDRYPNKVFVANADHNLTEQRVTTAEVLAFLDSGGAQTRDLAFWR